MSDFAQKLIAWQQQHGRHDLPWQHTRDPYAIWVSEIMLQQTQVSAVIGYYQRFMARFPTIASLAQAEQEEVMQHWSGLGYYSRARNLHHAAQTIMDEHQGQFPQDFATIQTLKGIGRSTAAAIVAFAFNQRQTILDGNVKRVFARYYAVEGWPGLPNIEKQLWQLAEQQMPDSSIPAYIQSLMDFGATLCTRSQPKCKACPLQANCQAYQQGLVKHLPTPKPRKALPEKNITMLVILHAGEVLLQKRPNHGIWGGLWSLPEIAEHEIATEVTQQRYGLACEATQTLPQIHHAFTHYKLHITPQVLALAQTKAPTPAQHIWLNVGEAIEAAIPTPVRAILKGLR
jgi:A/G-specific adenine glycosylase